VNQAKTSEKTLRSQFELLNVWGTSEDFDSTFSIEVRQTCLVDASLFAKAKESKTPRHLFVICLSWLFRTECPSAKMSSATIRA